MCPDRYSLFLTALPVRAAGGLALTGGLALIGLVFSGLAPKAARAQEFAIEQQVLRDLKGKDLEGRDGPLATLGFDLARLYRRYEKFHKQKRAGETFRARFPELPVRGGAVVVDAIAAEGGGQRLLSELRGLGGRGLERIDRLVSGQLPISALPEAARLQSLGSVEPAWQATAAGVTTTQGDSALHANVARSQNGFSGLGVTVGVVSDSYNRADGAATTAQEDISRGDLPPADRIQVLDDRSDSQDEGRAMMQIIHDIAPESDLAFHTSYGRAVFANGIRELASEAGAEVIVDDAFNFSEPFFQDGVIAQAVEEVANEGVAYFSAAGNRARQSYASAFDPSSKTGPNGGTLHDFGGGDTQQQITVPVGQYVLFALQWTDPSATASSGDTGADSDLNIYLVDQTDSTVARSAVSNIGFNPDEIIGFNNGGDIDADGDGAADTQFSLQIERAEGPVPDRIKYIYFNRAISIDEHAAPGPTSHGHYNAEGSHTVAAASYLKTPAYGTGPPVAQSFSSEGGIPIFFDDSGDRLDSPEIRQVPDVTGPDGGNTSFFGRDLSQDSDSYPNFEGTSAAAPHVAAVAALIRSKNRGLPSDSVYRMLEETAIDMDDPATGGFDSGYDRRTGFGLVQADEALGRVTSDRRPDLTVASLSFEPSFPGPEEVTVDFTIENQGSAGVGSFEWRLLADSTEVARQSVGRLKRGESKTLAYDLGTNPAGTIPVTVEADPADAIGEPDESNNRRSEDLVVGSAGPTELSLGEPVENLGGDAGSEKTFVLPASTLNTSSQGAGAARSTATSAANLEKLSFALSVGSGDPNLYVRFGEPPTTEAYDCQSVDEAGFDETCEFEDPATGNWYVTVRGASSYSDAILRVRKVGPTKLTLGEPMKNLSGSAGSKKIFVLPKSTQGSSAANLEVLRFKMSVSSGDPDLYVRFGEPPTTGEYDCRPFKGTGSDELCTFADPTAGNWYLMIRGARSYSGTALRAERKVISRSALAISGFEIRTDFPGNNDGTANPGEFLRLGLSLENESDSTLSRPYARLDSSFDKYVHPIGAYIFSTKSGVSQNVASGQTASTLISLHVGGDAPEGHVLRVPMTMYNEEDVPLGQDTLEVPVEGTDTTPPFIAGSYVEVQPGFVKPGNPTTISAFVKEGSQTVTAEASVESLGGQQTGTVRLVDDGSGGDREAGDRRFTGTFTPEEKAEYRVDVSATDDEGNTGGYEGASFTTKPFSAVGDVLVVADNGQPWTDRSKLDYTDPLLATGRRPDVWSVYRRGAPPAGVMSQYPSAVWYTGSGSIVPKQERAAVRQYLNGGGSLLIAGDNVANRLQANEYSSWLRENLHVEYVQGGIDRFEVDGIEGDPISGGLTFPLGRHVGDEVDPTNGGTQMLVYDDAVTQPQSGSSGTRSATKTGSKQSADGTESSGTAGIRYASGEQRLVYLAFGLEAAIVASDQRAQLVGRVMQWLENSLTASATRYVGEEGTVRFGETGLSLRFSGVTGPDSVTAAKFANGPSGTEGIPESNVSDYRFAVRPGSALSLDSTEVQLAVASLSGISDPTNVTIYKRAKPDTRAFSPLETITDGNGTPQDISDDTLSAWTPSLSEFVLASDSEPLPVELAAFEGELDDGTAHLTWRTASEQNNAGFEVQQQVRGGEEASWTQVGFVESKASSGTTTEPQAYRFTDAGLPYAADTLTYRLKQIDTDGSANYMETITLERGITEVQLLGTFPNPARQHATVRYALPEKQEVTVRLYDVLGRQVRTVLSGTQEGRHEQRLDVSGLSSGLYFLRLRAESAMKTQRLVILR